MNSSSSMNGASPFGSTCYSYIIPCTSLAFHNIRSIFSRLTLTSNSTFGFPFGSRSHLNAFTYEMNNLSLLLHVQQTPYSPQLLIPKQERANLESEYHLTHSQSIFSPTKLDPHLPRQLLQFTCIIIKSKKDTISDQMMTAVTYTLQQFLSSNIRSYHAHFQTFYNFSHPCQRHWNRVYSITCVYLTLYSSSHKPDKTIYSSRFMTPSTESWSTGLYSTGFFYLVCEYILQLHSRHSITPAHSLDSPTASHKTLSYLRQNTPDGKKNQHIAQRINKRILIL